jgi:hypothetical protein
MTIKLDLPNHKMVNKFFMLKSVRLPCLELHNPDTTVAVLDALNRFRICGLLYQKLTSDQPSTSRKYGFKL